MGLRKEGPLTRSPMNRVFYFTNWAYLTVTRLKNIIPYNLLVREVPSKIAHNLSGKVRRTEQHHLLSVITTST